MPPFFLRWRASHPLHIPSLASYSIVLSSWYLNFPCLVKENNIALDIRASWQRIHQIIIILIPEQNHQCQHYHSTLVPHAPIYLKRMRSFSFLPHCSRLDKQLQGTCFSREVGLDNLHRFLPTTIVLWFCDFSPWIFSFYSFLLSPTPQLE